MKSKLARYFTHVEGFGDDTVFFRFRGSGRGKRIAKDGSEHQSRISLRQALTSVKHGAWVEITATEANNMFDGAASRSQRNQAPNAWPGSVLYRCTKVENRIAQDHVLLEFSPPVPEFPVVVVKLPGISRDLFQVGEEYNLKTYGHDFPRGISEWHIDLALYDIRLEGKMVERGESLVISARGQKKVAP